MMSLPKIKVGVQEVQRHGAGVLKIVQGYYADIDDIAEAMHIQPEVIYGALGTLQYERLSEAKRDPSTQPTAPTKEKP